MRITPDLDLPDELLHAQREGQLVIFAGAGVSMNPPSDLPDFPQLVHNVTRHIGERWDESRETVDRCLGRLVRQGIKVHEIVAQQIGVPTSQPNVLHHTLLSLFPTPDQIRLVTTNFDMHFSTAAQALFADHPLETYAAPALPLGHSFTGLIALHGRITDPRRMVLTDDDFGRAYLTDGWARRFLQGMFAQYTVLFVGYSYRDPVVGYLARGLPPGSAPRFVVAPANDDDHWAHLGITHIPYPAAEHHRALREGMDAWARQTRMGAFEHEQRIRTIVDAGPPLDILDSVYLTHAVQAPVTARFFARAASSVAWLQWIADHPAFSQLFTRQSIDDDLAHVLAYWFANRFILQTPLEAMAIIHRGGGTVSAVCWEAIASTLAFADPFPEPQTVVWWTAFLINTALETVDHGVLAHVLSQCRYPDDLNAIRLLFQHLLRLRVRFTPAYFSIDELPLSARFHLEVTTVGDHFSLWHVWEILVRPHLAACLTIFAPLLTDVILRVEHTAVALSPTPDRYDPFTFSRQAIESYGSYHVPEPMDVVIDMARDIIETALQDDPPLADRIITEWSMSGVPLLQRLALHGLRTADHRTADARIALVLAHEWVYDPNLKHEVLWLLRTLYPQTSTPMRRRLITRILAGRPHEDESVSQAYHVQEAYNLLAWLRLDAADCPLLRDASERLLHRQPGMTADPHLDTYFRTSTVNSTATSALTAEQMRTTRIEDSIDVLLHATDTEAQEYGRGRYGILQAVTTAVTQDVAWSWDLVQCLQARHAWETDLWVALLRGWRTVALSEDHWGHLFQVLAGHPSTQLFAQDVADLLLRYLRHGQRPEDLPQLSAARQLAFNLFDTLLAQEDTTPDTSDDWLNAAINHPGGLLAQFWITSLYHEKSQQEHQWHGMTDADQRFLTVAMTHASDTAQMARVSLAHEVCFLMGIAPDDTRQQLLPWFRWESNVRGAQQVWHGYLAGTCMEPVFAEMRPAFAETFAHVADLGPLYARRFVEHVAVHAVTSATNPLADHWLEHFMHAIDGPQRCLWAETVAKLLAQVPSPERTALWARWMQPYWQTRLHGIPVPLAPTEVAAMYGWLPAMTPVITEMVELVLAGPSPVFADASVFRTFLRSDLAATHPQAIAEVLTHALTAMTGVPMALRVIEDLLEPIPLTTLPDALRRRLADELARLGSAKAAEIAPDS